MLVYGVGALSALLCFCALLLDLGLAQQAKVRAQNAADAAAIGAVFDYQDGGSYSRGGAADASLNGSTAGSNTTVTISNPPTSGAYSGNAYAVQATVSTTAPAVFLPQSTTVTATATAMRVPTPCVYMLSRQSPSISLYYGNQADQYTCPTYVGASYGLGGGATVTGSQFFVAGKASSSYGGPSPAAIFGAPTLADPLAYLPPPPVGSTCTRVNSAAITTNTTLNPGLYCGGLTIGDLSHAPTVTFNPGTYVLTGPLVVPQAALNGAGITLYIAGGSGSNASSILNLNGTLSAPTTGTWQGILFYSDRSLAAGQANLTMNNWNRGSKMDGIFYLPNQQLLLSNIALKPVHYLGIVADSCHINNTDLAPASDYSTLANGNPFHPMGGGGGIVE